jgi:hypothetical protein
MMKETAADHGSASVGWLAPIVLTTTGFVEAALIVDEISGLLGADGLGGRLLLLLLELLLHRWRAGVSW